MNQTFNFQRFMLVLRLEIAEKGRTQLLMATVLVGVMLLMLIPITFSKEYNDRLFSLHIIAMLMIVLFGGSLYTNQVFGQYNSTNSAIAALMVPASRLEKFLSTLLLNLAFIIPFFLLFIGLHIWTTDFANSHLLPEENEYKPLQESALWVIFAIATIIQGACFLGAIYFTRAAYIKTAAAFFITIIFGSVANYYFAKSIVPLATNLTATPFLQLRLHFIENNQYYNIDPPQALQYFVNTLPILVLLALWYIAYLRMVEKEV